MVEEEIEIGLEHEEQLTRKRRSSATTSGEGASQEASTRAKNPKVDIVETFKEEEIEREKQDFTVHIHKKHEKKDKKLEEGSSEKKENKIKTPPLRACTLMKSDVLVSNML